MLCPSCKGSSLQPVKLEKDLAALGCKRCRGVLLPILSYREWIERHPIESRMASRRKSKLVVEDSTHAMLCPKCSGLMTKYRISADTENKIDLCIRCNESWLDSGEWQLLKQLDIQKSLPSIFTDSWQRDIRKKQSENLYERKYTEMFGSDYQKVKQIKSWINKHPKKNEIMYYLNMDAKNN